MTNLQEVKLPENNHSIENYKGLTPDIYKKIKTFSKSLKNKTIIHISSTAAIGGGGVAEILKSQVFLENSLGIKSYWFVINNAPDDFFNITKKMHNLFQGKNGLLSKKEKDLYLKTNENLGESVKVLLPLYDKKGIVVIHDPQPLPLINFIPKDFFSILRLHIDLLTPNKTVIDFLWRYIKKYEKIILTNKDYRYALPLFPDSKIKFIAPAIDPFTIKNQEMKLEKAREIIKQFNINYTKPILTQVSRFDPWKDPIGVIEAYYLAKNQIPDLQLILAGFVFAQDDPEAKKIFIKVKKYAKGDPADIHLFSDPRILGNLNNDTFINAVYTASDIIIQKSVREGFGLTITEAMWKGKPVIAGKTTGALMQIEHNKNGLIVNSIKEAASVIIKLAENEQLRGRLGKEAHLSVKNNFLMPRFILDNLRVYNAKTISGN